MSEDPERDKHILGIVDDSYDRLYKEISKLSISRKCFLLTFETGEEIKAIRLQQQERVEYDEHGYFLSSIRFVISASIGTENSFERFNPC